MVRLRGFFQPNKQQAIKNFNSTMVRLREQPFQQHTSPFWNFNSTMVRLRAVFGCLKIGFYGPLYNFLFKNFQHLVVDP